MCPQVSSLPGADRRLFWKQVRGRAASNFDPVVRQWNWSRRGDSNPQPLFTSQTDVHPCRATLCQMGRHLRKRPRRPCRIVRRRPSRPGSAAAFPSPSLPRTRVRAPAPGAWKLLHTAHSGGRSCLMSASAADVPVPGVGRTTRCAIPPGLPGSPTFGLRANRKERLDLLNANRFGNDADSLSGEPLWRPPQLSSRPFRPFRIRPRHRRGGAPRRRPQPLSPHPR